MTEHQQLLFYLANETVVPLSLFVEQLLLKSLSNGDRQVFWQLWLPYEDCLQKKCLIWMNGHIEDAEDAFSQATLKAWGKLFVNAHLIIDLQAWLIRFTYNVCMDIHRAKQRKAIANEKMKNLSAENIKVDLLELSPVNNELEIKIRAAIKTLPIRLSLVFLMRFEEDISYTDIAQKLNISKENVYKRISQARAILQPQINAYLLEKKDSTFTENQSNQIKSNPSRVKINFLRIKL